MPVCEYSFQRFHDHTEIDKVIVIARQENIAQIRAIAKKYPKITEVLCGGGSRFESSVIAYKAARTSMPEVFVFHNLANPLVTSYEITNVIAGAYKTGAAGVAREITSTIRRQGGGTIPRENLLEMETPQAMRTAVFQMGLGSIQEIPTDDLAIAEAAGVIPEIIAASAANRKITLQQDLQFLEDLMKKPSQSKIAVGADSHAFDTEGELVLGGVEVFQSPKLKADSDGDAVLHAICNAVCSALGTGSFSQFADPLCKQGVVDSAEYVRAVLYRLHEEKGKIESVSITIEAQRPKLEPLLPHMQKAIADLCDLDGSDIGITVHSGDGLTEAGRGKGISVLALLNISFY